QRWNICTAGFRSVPPAVQGEFARNRARVEKFSCRRCKRIQEAAEEVRSISLRGTTFHFDGDHSFIVESFNSGSMVGSSLENGFNHGLSRISGTLGDDLFQPSTPKKVTGLVRGIKNAVAEEHENVFGLGLKGKLVVLRVVEQAERQTSGFNQLRLAFVTVHRTRQTGIRNLKCAVNVVPDGVNQRDELAFDPP